MSDLLTHVLVGYVIGAALSLRLRWIGPPHITIVMAGALLPDFAKIYKLIPPSVIEANLGVTFGWFAIHAPFGAMVATGIIALLVERSRRYRVFALLASGVASHFVLDALLLSPSRFYRVLLWPASTRHISLPGLYLSSDPWTVVVAFCLAGVLWAARRQVVRN